MVKAVIYLTLLLVSNVGSAEGGRYIENIVGENCVGSDQGKVDKEQEVDGSDGNSLHCLAMPFSNFNPLIYAEYPRSAVTLHQTELESIRAPPAFLI
jgi:hypothetical protein